MSFFLVPSKSSGAKGLDSVGYFLYVTKFNQLSQNYQHWVLSKKLD